MNVIASQRALGYANHFKKFGFEPTIVTHDWTKTPLEQYCLPSEFEEKTIFEENEMYKVYRIPILKHKRARVLGWLEKKPLLNKVGILMAWVFGHLDTTSLLLDYKLSERRFLKKHLSENKYDVMMGIFSPHFHLSNCSWAGKKFGVKYVLDYRDLWDNKLLIANYNPDSKERFRTMLNVYYWKKWGVNSVLQTITSDYWANRLNGIKLKNVKVVFNGFEKSSIDKCEKEGSFSIIHAGSIYNHQEFEVFFEGVRRFVEECKPEKFKITFLGADREIQGKGVGSMISPKEISKFCIGLENYVDFTTRVAYPDVLRRMSTSHLLYLPSFPNSPGTYGGKIFEYLNAKKPILVVPSDNDVLDGLLDETGAGVSISKPVDLKKYLCECYRNFENGVEIEYNGNAKEIDKYSRESQTKKMANFIKLEMEKTNAF